MSFMDSLYRWKRPDRAQSPLRSGLQKVIRELTAGKRGGNRRKAQRLPWYLLLGLPHSGKSSLLPVATENQWRKIGSLREDDRHLDCDWWHSGNAVVMDIHYQPAPTDDYGETSRWQQFARQLRECLQPKALRGVVLVVSADDLLDPDSEYVNRTARLLRQCLHELQSRYDYQIPCYLLINKCDCLTGFSEIFSTLSQEERNQPWGTTLNIASGADEISSHLNALHDAVQTMLPQRLQIERNAAIRRNIAAFPPQFARLQSTVMLLVSALFSRNDATGLPPLRGIYFASAGDSASHFFSERLFNEVVFADPMPAQPRDSSEDSGSRRQHLSFVAAGTALVLTFVLALTWSTAAFLVQQRDIAATQDLLRQNAGILTHRNDDGVQSFARSSDAVALLERALALSRRHSTGWAAPGMYDASVAKAVQSMHQQVLEEQWLPALAAHLLRWIPMLDTDPENQFAALKAWLMLADPTHRDIDFLQQWISHASPFDDAERTTINTRLLQLHDVDVKFAAPMADRRAVEQIRSRLAAIPLADRIYDQWQQHYRGKYLPLKPLLGAHVNSIFSINNESLWNMPALYTAEAYRRLHLEEKLKALDFLAHDQWVLGDKAPDPSQRAVILQTLKQRHLKEYARAWNSVFNALSLRRPAGSAALLAQLQSLSDPAISPLTALLKVSTEHTRPLIDTAHAFDRGDGGVAALEANLAELRDWLSVVHHTDRNIVATSTMSLGSITPPQKLLAFSAQLSPPVSSWVASLARATSASVDDRNRSAVDAAWRIHVADFCRASFGDRYPFAPHASTAASYGDFVEYFRPGGIEDGFVRAHLGNDIDRASWTSKPGATIKLPAHALHLLRQAQKIRNAFFQGPNAGFTFNVTPQRMSANLQRFTIEAGSANFRYSHGPRLKTQLRWPQDSDMLSVRFTSLEGNSVTRNHEGVWGLYHLLDAARQMRRSDSPGVTLALREGKQSIVLTLASVYGSSSAAGSSADSRPSEYIAENPLQRELLSDYRCIDSLR